MTSVSPTLLDSSFLADVWSPHKERGSPVPGFDLLILNTPIHSRLPLRLWKLASRVICADGGANRLYDSLAPSERNAWLPSVILGDLDSIRADVQAFYEDAGVPVQYDRDQDSTDLEKGFSYLANGSPDRCGFVIAFGGLEGRIDHVLAGLSALHKHQSMFARAVMMSESNWVEVLGPGSHTLRCALVAQGPQCGLVPLAGPAASVTTRGLQWNLKDSKLSVGGLISTSNRMMLEGDAFRAPGAAAEGDAPVSSGVREARKADRGSGFATIHVDTSDPIVWCTSMQKL